MPRVSSGESAARLRLEELFQVHYESVRRYARRRVAAELVDDVVSETFLVAWRRLEDVPADALPWLLGVARRRLATQRRAAVRREALAKKLAMTASRPHEDSAAPSETRGAVADALAKLRPIEREAITLVAWDELTPAQAAAALGQTRVAFRLRLHRARIRVRRELEQNPDGQAAAPLRPVLDRTSGCADRTT